jgi:hypothetical protein
MKIIDIVTPYGREFKTIIDILDGILPEVLISSRSINKF